MRGRSSPPRGSHGPSYRRTPATAPSTILAWMPVNHCQCGARRVGFIPTIRADGSNGIAATTWAGECKKRMRDRSGAGTLCAATWPKSNATANSVIRPAESARGRPSYTGPMTAERSEGLSGRQSARDSFNVGFGSLADITSFASCLLFPQSRHSQCGWDVRFVPCVDGSWLASQNFTSHCWSVQPCVRPVSAVRMTAGHNALRGSGPVKSSRHLPLNRQRRQSCSPKSGTCSKSARS